MTVTSKTASRNSVFTFLNKNNATKQVNSVQRIYRSHDKNNGAILKFRLNAEDMDCNGL